MIRDEPYINPFAATLIERNANVLYDGYLRADKPVTNRKFVKLWADSGCYRVRLGIESAASRVLDSMDKMTTPKIISDVLKVLAKEAFARRLTGSLDSPARRKVIFRRLSTSFESIIDTSMSWKRIPTITTHTGR